MGLRFRKSIKLAPGIRMNLGNGGVSWTLGPRGASVGIGKRGAYANIGLPGSGLSYRYRLDGAARPAAGVGTVDVNVTLAIADDGTIQYTDAAGNPVPDAWVRQAKRQHGDRIRQLIQEKCEELNAQVDALAQVHLYTPAPVAAPGFTRQPFDVPAPPDPVPRPYGLLARIFRNIARRIDEENAQDRAVHAQYMAQWDEARRRHDEAQTLLRQSYFSAMAGVPEHMEIVLEQKLQEIVWPRETNVAIGISDDGRRVALDADLPEIEQFPSRTASVQRNGFVLSAKDIGEPALRKLYARHVHAIGFRLLGEVFAALPTVEGACVSGYTTRMSSRSGHAADEYLYSVRATRAAWSAINFASLGAIDVIDAFTQFDLRRAWSPRTGVLAPVQPFTDVASLSY